MLKALCCDTPTRRVRLGWLSFQKNGDVSFGLSDDAYISPVFDVYMGVWSLYNRVRTRFQIVSDPTTANKVRNPHLTWHAPAYFHFKSSDQKASEASFKAIADVPLMLWQQHEVKWITATSGQISKLKTAGNLRGRYDSEEITIRVPSEYLSVQMHIDFVRPNTQAEIQPTQRIYTWQKVGVRVRMAYTYPQFPTMAWAHYH
jgi:hypothetical protein